MGSDSDVLSTSEAASSSAAEPVPRKRGRPRAKPRETNSGGGLESE